MGPMAEISIRLRAASPGLLALPWLDPLEKWSDVDWLADLVEPDAEPGKVADPDAGPSRLRKVAGRALIEFA